MLAAIEHIADLIEPFHIPDTFISGIGRIDRLEGGMVRVVFYSEEPTAGRMERVVVCKIVRPVATWGAALKLMAAMLEQVNRPSVVN